MEGEVNSIRKRRHFFYAGVLQELFAGDVDINGERSHLGKEWSLCRGAGLLPDAKYCFDAVLDSAAPWSATMFHRPLKLGSLGAVAEAGNEHQQPPRPVSFGGPAISGEFPIVLAETAVEVVCLACIRLRGILL